MKVMAGTTKGQGRLKKLLPTGILVAHKTGTAGINQDSLERLTSWFSLSCQMAETWLLISVFVSNSTESKATNERIIAEIAKLGYEHFVEVN